MVDSFYLGAYWGSRHQDLETVVQLTIKTLIGLQSIDEQFSNLYELGRSRKQALTSKINLNTVEIEQLYKKRLKKTDIDEQGKNRIGYRLSLWTGQADDESIGLSFVAGASSMITGNLCLINFPYKFEIKDRLLKFEKIKSIVDLLIDNWQPDKLILTSKKISGELAGMNDTGWITYKKNISNAPKLGRNIIYDPNYKKGHLFHLRTDNGMVYDYGLIEDLKLLGGL
ncbi:Imm52 family immunity protein [Pedobacter vanadiisoli]|uniref:Imm52 family immunity protein n=1 Tax=Pedobacter vanadiisoli TaxID=1761975 RepID=A0ABW5MM29_9SPHI